MNRVSFFYVILFSFALNFSVFGQRNGDLSICKKMGKALEEADVAAIANCLNSTITLEVADAKGIFSKAQSIIILKGFFKKKSVESYIEKPVKDKGFCYGLLKTSTEDYYVYYKFRDFYGRILVYDLKITLSN